MIALGLAILPLTAAAQRVTITPNVGAYLPFATQSKGAIIMDCFRPPCPHGSWRATLTSAATFGLSAALVWDRVGFELAIITSETERRMEEIMFSGEPGDLPFRGVGRSAARTTVTAIRILLERPMGSGMDVAVGVGLAATRLSGAAYSPWNIADQTIGGLTLSTRLGLALTPRTRLEMGLVDNIYAVKVGAEGAWDRRSFLQHDVFVSSGIALQLGTERAR